MKKKSEFLQILETEIEKAREAVKKTEERLEEVKAKKPNNHETRIILLMNNLSQNRAVLIPLCKVLEAYKKSGGK